MQISFLRHAYSLTFVLGGLGGMREDARGVGKPLDAPKDPSADLGNFLPLFGTSQPLPLLPDLCMQRSTKTPPSMHLTGLVSFTNERSFLTSFRPDILLNLS